MSRPRLRGLTPFEAEDIDRPGALADAPQAVADGLRGDSLRDPGGLERVEAEGELSGQGRRVSAARSVRCAVVVALARQLDDPLAVEEEIRGLVAVAAQASQASSADSSSRFVAS